MKKTIIYHFILAGFIAAMFTSCSEDELDLQPLSAIGSNGFYTNTEEVEGAVIAIYDGLQQVPLREFALFEMRTDNTESNTGEGVWGEFNDFDVLPTNLAVGEYWAANYNVIFRANKVLENLEVVTDAAAKAQFEGEALFARALAHFNLVQGYGDVPYVDKVIIQTDTDYFDRDPASTVLTNVISDLTRAVGLLLSKGDTEFGRATNSAAEAVLAKVYLTTGDYGTAEVLFGNIINSGEYSLQTSYADVFYNEGNDEIIFAIPYVNDDVNESQDFSFEMTIGGRNTGLNFATTDFLTSMDPEDIERAPILINPATTAESGKFVTSSSDARLCGNDWIVMRYADVLMMYAEAIMAGNGSTQDLDALGAYNMIRERVGLSTLPLDGSATLDDVTLLDERRMELAFENHRLNDLKRFGKAESVLGAFAARNSLSFTATDLILPIPQGEINVSSGLLTQNPGY
ncbi:MAG: RagB/SusD family nutrient uptake outer membrane protein [Bacteroidota bacterium]